MSAPSASTAATGRPQAAIDTAVIGIVDRIDPRDVPVRRDVRPEGRSQLVRLLGGEGLAGIEQTPWERDLTRMPREGGGSDGEHQRWFRGLHERGEHRREPVARGGLVHGVGLQGRPEPGAHIVGV